MRALLVSLVVFFSFTACPPPPLLCGMGTHEEAGVCVVDPTDAGSADAGSADAGSESDAGSTDAGLPDAGPLPPLEMEADCAHQLGGAPGPGTLSALSEAHISVRFFGPFTRMGQLDDALAMALGSPQIDAAALARYGAALPGVCALPADPRALPAARVERVGPVAVIHPGTGSVSVPSDATAVAVDLRGLPNAPGLDAALQAATQAALAAPLPRATQSVRSLYGAPDESGQPNIYESSMKALPVQSWPGAAAQQRPLAVLTDGVSAPACAELAGTLRLLRAAWLFGEPVFATVAESSWQGWGQVGLGYRSMNLSSGGARWPERIDVDQADVDAALSGLAARGAVSEAAVMPATRPALGPVDPKAAGADKGLTLGTARAALLTIHGALRRFFPYFKVVGDQIDPRLDETMATVANAPTLDRKLFFDTVGRLGEAVHDGHNFIYDVSGAWSAAGYFPVIIDQVQGEPVIRKSAEPKVKPGEAITSIAGVPAGQWYAQEYPRTAGATPGYRFDLATRKYTQLFGPTAFGIRALDGGTRVETITPAPLETVQPLYADERHAERLGALGAPDLQYVNLDSAGLDEQHTCLAAMTQAQGAAGLVLDMRGYPGDEAWGCLGNLTNVRIWSPLWRVPQWTGPDTFSVDQSQWSVDPASPPFAGPIVLLVGPTTVSAAETVSTLLVDARRVKKVVGRTSAGTNGNITYLRTTAGIYFSFTGMEVLHTDGGTYHGIGIVPDVVVEPTAQDFADGRDRTIEAAIAALRAP